ncbi:MAG TPA: molybdopterin-dependent oxidoreductase, partial [Candidatus Polarisedimenticolia bacterium]|nr:molybdopterin-dependent oxidoreductase [Candidatus Polarisedimenticolia bacterium]
AEDIAAGRVKGLVVVGEDPLGDGLLGTAALEGLEALVVLDSWKSPTAEAAHVAIPICGYGEEEGVYVNFEGRAQRARQALKPQGETEPAWSVLAELGRRFGMEGAYPSSAAVLQEIAEKVPAFKGITYRALGPLGVVLKGA